MKKENFPLAEKLCKQLQQWEDVVSAIEALEKRSTEVEIEKPSDQLYITLFVNNRTYIMKDISSGAIIEWIYKLYSDTKESLEKAIELL